jgi:3-methyl-2-oxobutanoate hydroxymethyltransferase
MSITPKHIMSYRETGRKITMLTAYDYSMARMVDSAGIDIILVGDSLGMVILGYDSTVPVTMDEMLHHCRAVSRGTKNAMVVGDMPFMSYQVSKKEAVRNAGRFIKEAGCHAVKLEGGREMASTISRIVTAGIPVMGHIGLTPQTATALGGYKVQGKDLESARKLLKDAEAVDGSGAFALVLECVPDTVAKLITERISIPTIGIGAGPWCSGQVLVTHDLLGMFDKFCPSFVKQYAKLSESIKEALSAFVDEVGQGAFPDAAHSFQGDEQIVEKLAGKRKK